MASYPHLFFPLKVGAQFLKNRIVMAPIETGLEQQNYLDERIIEFYRDRSKDNGPGLFIIGNGVTHFTGLRNLSDPVLTSSYLNNAIRLTSVLHEHGSKAILQLQHHGAQANHMFAICASNIRNRDTGRIAHRAPGILIPHLISQYALHAYNAIQHGGFDGVEIYGGRLSLPHVFSSKLFNHRHDKWGLHSRTLFALEIVRRIRSYIGPSPILAYRLSLLDVNSSGTEWHDLLAFAQALKYEGVNLFSFDIALSPNSIPVNSDLTPAGAWLPFMEKFSKEIKVPVIFGHRLPEPQKLDELVKNNITCLVELGRPFIADPKWVQRLQNNQPAKPCTLCPQGCLAYDANEGREVLSCVAFPGLLKRAKKRSNPRKVLVVGGGPAGLSAAKEAAIQGHQVTLADENAELGGLYRLCAKIPGRENIRKLIAWQEKELQDLGVSIIRRLKVTPQWIEDNYSDHFVILATGTETIIPDIPGIDNPNVLTVEDLLQDRTPVGHRVAVIGVDYLAVDVVRFLCTKNITNYDDWYCAWGIGDPAKHLGGMLGVVPHLMPPNRKTYLLSQSTETSDENFSAAQRLYELQWLRMHGANIFTQALIEQIDSHSVRVMSQGEDSSTILRVDHIVIAGEREPKDELSNELDSLGISCLTVGSMNTHKGMYFANQATLEAIQKINEIPE